MINRNIKYNKIFKHNSSSYKKNKNNNNLDKELIIEAGEYIYNSLKNNEETNDFNNKEDCFNDEFRTPNIEIPDDLDYDDIFLINDILKENYQFNRIQKYSTKYNLKDQVNEELSNEFDLDNEDIPDWYEDDEINDQEFKDIVNNTNKFNENNKVDTNQYCKEMENNINKLLNRENDENEENKENTNNYDCKAMENNINQLWDLDGKMDDNKSIEEESKSVEEDSSKSVEEDSSKSFMENKSNNDEENKFNNILNIFDKNNININKLDNINTVKNTNNNLKEVNKPKNTQIEEISLNTNTEILNDKPVSEEVIMKKNNSQENNNDAQTQKIDLSPEELEKLKKVKKEQFILKYSYLDNIICCMAYDTFNSRNIDKINKHSIVGINIENIILYTSHSYKIFSYYVQGKVFDKFWYYKDKLKITQGPLMSFDMDIYNIKGKVFENDTLISPDNINFLPYNLYQDRELIAINTIQNQINNLENQQEKNNYYKNKNSKKNKGKFNNNTMNNQNTYKRNNKKSKNDNNLTENLKSLLGIDKEPNKNFIKK